MLINLIFKDIQSARDCSRKPRHTGGYSLYGCINLHVYTMTQKKLTIFVACFNTLQKGSDSLNNQGKCIIEN